MTIEKHVIEAFVKRFLQHSNGKTFTVVELATFASKNSYKLAKTFPNYLSWYINYGYLQVGLDELVVDGKLSVVYVSARRCKGFVTESLYTFK